MLLFATPAPKTIDWIAWQGRSGRCCYRPFGSRESPALSDSASRLAAPDDAVAGAIVASTDQSRVVPRAEDRSDRSRRHRARPAGAGGRGGRTGNAEPLVSLRLVRADRGGPPRRHAVSL